MTVPSSPHDTPSGPPDASVVDPDCPLAVLPSHRCERNTGDAIRAGETCWYGANVNRSTGRIDRGVFDRLRQGHELDEAAS